MPRRVFISYKYTDRTVAHNVHVFFQHQGGACDGKPAYVEEDVAPQGDDAIKRVIRDRMERCDAVLFVVGDDSHNSRWMEYEAQLARNWKKPMLAVQAPGTTGGVPNVIKNDVQVVSWGHDTLCSVLNRADRSQSPSR